VVFNHFPEIARQLPELTHELLEDAAEAVAEEARANVPVGATGKLRDSIVTKVEKERALVLVKKFYGLFLEFGTVKMAARPFLTPAAEKMRPWFVERCKEMLGRLGR
jgi:HK97 gp10 family phage protein